VVFDGCVPGAAEQGEGDPEPVCRRDGEVEYRDGQEDREDLFNIGSDCDAEGPDLGVGGETDDIKAESHGSVDSE